MARRRPQERQSCVPPGSFLVGGLLLLASLVPTASGAFVTTFQSHLKNHHDQKFRNKPFPFLRNSSKYNQHRQDDDPRNQDNAQLEPIDDNNNNNKTKNNNNDDSNNEDTLWEQFNDFLDKPYFDPSLYDDSDNSTWLARLANFVKSDPDRAEVLLAGAFFFVMIVISQELFRLQLYGPEHYVPFTPSSSSNALWRAH